MSSIGGDVSNWQLVTASPMQPVGLESGVAQVATTGRGATCALTTTGVVKCWGDATFGELGRADASTTPGNSDTPRDVEDLETGVVQIAAGYSHVCALMKDATMKCWGYNQNGQLGDQPAALTVNLSSATPVVVKDVSDVSVIAVGASHSCAALKKGGVLCWGSGQSVGSTLGTEIHPNPIQGI